MPFVGKACEAAGHIFVDKSGPKKVIETIEHARHVLQDGTSLVVFPEGARTFTGHMGYFKKGAFQLADDLQLPVVPLTIIGSFNILPRTGGFVSWHPMKLVVHKPIYPQSQGMENIKATMEEAYREIEKDLPENIKENRQSRPRQIKRLLINGELLIFPYSNGLLSHNPLPRSCF